MCGISDWNKIWGDPIVSGSVFMVSYGGTAFLVLRVARRLAGRERVLWSICGALFLFQVANTHLDLHAFVFTFGRCLAHAQGWYQDRREVQFLVLAAAAALALAMLLVLVLVFRKHISGNALLIAGVGTALGMTLTKGINYHNLERYYGGDFGFFRGADLIEYAGIVLALSAALLRRRALSAASTG